MTISLGQTLPARINTATRKQHTELNRLLIQRLPLALPPYQRSPLLFAKGIVPFARLFVFFETEWDLLIRHVDKHDSSTDSHDHKVRAWLANLRPESLARSSRLKNDMKHLRLVAKSAGMFKTAELGEAWTQEMRLLMRRKPHVFVAFAWVFYMATFSGGRWIRQQLLNAGEEFWTGEASGGSNSEKRNLDTSLRPPGFTFLSFDGEQDGEDIKASFKLRLADAETILTAEEQHEIIDVAGRLFDRCLGLVGELDAIGVWERAMTWVPKVLLVVLLLAALLILQLNGTFTRLGWL